MMAVNIGAVYKHKDWFRAVNLLILQSKFLL